MGPSLKLGSGSEGKIQGNLTICFFFIILFTIKKYVGRKRELERKRDARKRDKAKRRRHERNVIEKIM
jgi:hypothetical protein